MDLAVGVIVGGAFQAIVNSLVGDILSPILGIFGGMDLSQYSIQLRAAELNDAGEVVKEALTLNYGAFIMAIINFLIMAFIIFLLVKGINKLSTLGRKKVEEEPAAPTTKVCPYCKSEIAIDAVKCPHCTSDVECETD
jgi:large conductance mechanosensitive channel